MIGVQSSLIMFPVNILIVSIFRFTRPREFSCCQRKKKKKNTQDSSATTDMTNRVSLDVIIKVGVSCFCVSAFNIKVLLNWHPSLMTNLFVHVTNTDGFVGLEEFL